jgi:hypothetical protein
MLSSFLGVLPILTPPLCALAFIMCSKSNPLVVFALDLMSTYEGEHTIFGLLGQANLTQNDVLQFIHLPANNMLTLNPSVLLPFRFWRQNSVLKWAPIAIIHFKTHFFC